MATWRCAKRTRQYTHDTVRLVFSYVGELQNALANIPADWDVYSDEEGNFFAESQRRPETDDEWKKRVDAEIAKWDDKFPAIVNPVNVRYIIQRRIADDQVFYDARNMIAYPTPQAAIHDTLEKELCKRLSRMKVCHVRAIEVHPNGSWNPVRGADELFFVRLGE